MEKYKPCVRYVGVLRCRCAAVAAIWSFLCGGAAAFNTFAGIALLIAGTAAAAFYIKKYVWLLYRVCTCFMHKDLVVVTKGVVLYKVCTIRYDAISYVCTTATPLQRLAGVADIFIFTDSGYVGFCGADTIPRFLKEFLH